jgi:tetratricopeptide (TPR) repeat protein
LKRTLLLLVLAPSLAFGQQGELGFYLTTAGHYAAGSRAAAVREIQTWEPHHIDGAVAALQGQRDRLRSEPRYPGDIDFRTVEAAVLLHAEAGLVRLQERGAVAARMQLDTAVDLYQWSRRAVVHARNRTAIRRSAFKEEPGPRFDLQTSIDGRDFYVALAAAALALGYAEPAMPMAERARLEAPRDAEVQLLLGCAAAALADEKVLERRDADAERARADAERSFREALALSPETPEARIRLGKLLLDRQRPREAEPLLDEADRKAADDRQRYLARLFLGRAAERGARPEDAVAAYRRALEVLPQGQAARLGLALALERSSGPAVSRELVRAMLATPAGSDSPSDPWFLYPVGPPGLAEAAFDRVFRSAPRR